MMTKQRGNILFLILLAIILFVALNYAVMGSMNGGGTKKPTEKYAATLASMRNVSTQLMQAITRLRLTNDCSETELSFEHPSFAAATNPYGAFNTTYANPNAPANLECNVFDQAGGGLSVPAPLLQSQGTKLSSASYQIRAGVIFDGVGTSASDLFLLIGPITADLCEYINSTNNITATPQIANFGSSVPAKGDFSGAYRTFSSSGKEFYCFNNWSDNYYVEVLLVR